MNEDLFEDARGKIGIYPIDVNNIKKFSENKDDIDSNYLMEFNHINARNSAAEEFLTDQLKFHVNEILIRHIKMSQAEDSRIMWIDIGEQNVRRLFHRAASIRNPNVRLINYIPQTLWKKKKQLNL